MEFEIMNVRKNRVGENTHFTNKATVSSDIRSDCRESDFPARHNSQLLCTCLYNICRPKKSTRGLRFGKFKFIIYTARVFYRPDFYEFQNL